MQPAHSALGEHKPQWRVVAGIKHPLTGLTDRSRKGARGEKMLSRIANVSLGILFAAIGGTNVWLMLGAARSLSSVAFVASRSLFGDTVCGTRVFPGE
jgi:hypothetical protein